MGVRARPMLTREPAPWRWHGLAVQAIWWVLAFTILVRASVDRLFEMVQLGGSGLTIGVVPNIVVLATGTLALAVMPARHAGRIALVWTPYLAWMLFTCLYAPELKGAVRLLLVLLTYPAMFAMAVASVTTVARLRRLFGLALLSLAPPALFAAAEWVMAPGERVKGTFTHPNIAGLYLVALLVVATWVLYRRYRELDVGGFAALIVAIAVAALFLLGTGTRSAWAAAAVVAVIFCVLVDLRGLLLLPLAAAALLIPSVQQRLLTVDDRQDVPDYMVTSGEVALDSYSWRRILWRHAFEDSADHRVRGEGLGAFRVNAPRFFPLGEQADAHSSFVQTIYEGGIIGLAVYCWIPLALLGMAWRQARAGARIGFPAAALLATYLLVSYSDNVIYYLAVNWYIWAFLGALIGSAWSVTEGGAMQRGDPVALGRLRPVARRPRATQDGRRSA